MMSCALQMMDFVLEMVKFTHPVPEGIRLHEVAAAETIQEIDAGALQ